MTAPAPRWALITGVSPGGLGDALTHALLSQSIHVIATALSLQQLDYLPENNRALAKVELDVTSPASIAAAVAATNTITGGRLDFLINNAGYGYMTPLLDADVAAVKANFDVNVFGLLAVTQAFFPLLRVSKGVVVNHGSIVGLRVGRQPFIGVYAASKAAVLSVNDTMRLELGVFGIQVVALVTGDVRTNFWANVHGAHDGLTEHSVYTPWKGRAEQMMRGETNPPGQHERERWAREVVGDLLGRQRRYIWRGYLAWTVEVASWVLPWWVLDYVHIRAAGLDGKGEEREREKEVQER